MFDPTSKIASINSFREADTGASAGGQKRKPQTKHAAPPAPPTEPIALDEDRDEHNLDTLA